MTKPTKFYLHADLYTADRDFAAGNDFVVRVGLPPFQRLPEVIQWGSRPFYLKHPPDGNTKAGEIYRYHEVFCYPVPPGHEIDNVS